MLALSTAANGQVNALGGRVTAAVTDQPLADVRVMIVGTSLFGITNADGRYAVRGVPTGTAVVRLLRVGYQEQKQSVVISAGQSATLDAVMAPSIVKLQELVTTATGEQRRVELGNSVGTINAAELTVTAPIARVDNLLTARVPGVVLLDVERMQKPTRRGRKRAFTLPRTAVAADFVRLTLTNSGCCTSIELSTLSQVTGNWKSRNTWRLLPRALRAGCL